MPGERESGSAERLFFFSDAVVAIAITLLALELPLPTGKTVHEFWRSFQENDAEYLAFLISFVVVARMWSSHHHLLSYVEHSDARLRTWNMLWLLMIVLNPTATKLLADNQETSDTHALRFGFYALLQLLASLAFLAMVSRVQSRRLETGAAFTRAAQRSRWRCYGIAVGFGASIPLFFVTSYAWGVWIAGSLLIPRLDPSRRGGATAAG